MKRTLTHRIAGLPPAVRRLIAIALLPLGAGLVWLLVIGPVVAAVTWHSEWRSDAQRIVSQARGSKAAATETVEQLASLAANPLWGKFYSVDKAGAAVPALQADVSAVLAASHGLIQSSSPLPPVVEDGLTKIGLRIAASLTVDQLKTFTESIARHPRYLRIEKLSILAPSMQVPDQNPMLTVTMDVFGAEWVRTDLAAAVLQSAPVAVMK